MAQQTAATDNARAFGFISVLFGFISVCKDSAIFRFSEEKAYLFVFCLVFRPNCSIFVPHETIF